MELDGRVAVKVLVVNPGSSSLKLRLLGSADEILAETEVPAPDGEFDMDSLTSVMSGPDIGAVCYRVVHGGDRFLEPRRLDDASLGYLRSLIPLAPLHQRFALQAAEAGMHLLPQAAHVAAFDTAFHATLPAAASTYAIPADWRRELGIRRYGFHGLSHSYAARRARELAGPARRCVTCHLGAGASLAAVLDGRSVDTTMGFTPLEGLVMATRSGSLDPGIVTWVQHRAGLDPEQVLNLLDRESGLRGLAGTPDMRQVVEQAGNGDGDAELALEVYVHRLRGLIAAMAAALDGLDVLVFTGGVGERSAEVRARTAAGLGFLGVALDPARNLVASVDGEITGEDSRVTVLVVEAREDLEMARQVRQLLGGGAA